MRREAIAPRPNWEREVEALGFGFHTLDGRPYWREDACYVFDAAAIDAVEAATAEVHALCLEAVDRIVRAGRYEDLGIDARAAHLVERSWWNRDPALYGRMDLSWDGTSPPKLLEYNADTPTSLFEASVVQWYWLEACYPGDDQFNAIHEQLVERWRLVGGGQRVHFAACYDNPEDGTTTDYLLDTCMQAGHDVQALDIEEIGWSGRDFIDLADRPIDRLFKLYPWEWLLAEPFAAHLPGAGTRWVEPPWKMLLSNKAILPLLWEFFPGHPNLLPASRRREDIDGAAVAKPYWGREGEGIAILDARQGAVLAPQRIYQALAPLPVFDGRHALVGSWVVGDTPAGIGMREDDDRITRNTSCFVPHRFR
ncbi:glutathionylspermidine synthase family protein [Luteibacter sahnii]|uniref:glutathionylspermidine synthase family protein n=1 Tax=Luteibacter sahnii TaxID=3021977 RepID=UPI002A6A9360|nr:glutathionylspermidine synthase family protein [Luteibacter sp. PPL193]MDY1549732.1 glutathionylspermidine synthase family protein [Luteibacter sp. PPL193]